LEGKVAEEAWTVYWDYGMTDYYALAPGDQPHDPYDVLILTVNPDGHENGYDEKTAETCAKALTDWHSA
jgi:hypothetical protein